MSRERFLRLLNAAEYLAAHIHEAPVWIVACLEGGTPTRTSGSSIYPAVQNMLLAARALGLGATLTTLYLNFEKEAEAAIGLPSGVHSYARLPDGPGLGQSVVLRFQMSFMEIGGVSIIGIRDALSRLNAAALGLWRAKEAQHKDAFLTVA
jgi:nitroreductase